MDSWPRLRRSSGPVLRMTAEQLKVNSVALSMSCAKNTTLLDVLYIALQTLGLTTLRQRKSNRPVNAAAENSPIRRYLCFCLFLNHLFFSHFQCLSSLGFLWEFKNIQWRYFRHVFQSVWISQKKMVKQNAVYIVFLNEGAARLTSSSLFASLCMLITAQQKFPIWRTWVPVYSPFLSTSPLISNPIEVRQSLNELEDKKKTM